jgi:hypothetical protein
LLFRGSLGASFSGDHTAVETIGRKNGSTKRLGRSGHWFHLSAVDLPWRQDFVRGSATGGGLTAISPWERRAEKLLPNLCIRLNNLFIQTAAPFSSGMISRP